MVRDAIALNEAHAVYSEAAETLRELNRPIGAARMRRAARAELLNPEPPERPCSICGGDTICVGG